MCFSSRWNVPGCSSPTCSAFGATGPLAAGTPSHAGWGPPSQMPFVLLKDIWSQFYQSFCMAPIYQTFNHFFFWCLSSGNMWLCAWLREEFVFSILHWHCWKCWRNVICRQLTFTHGCIPLKVWIWPWRGSSVRALSWYTEVMGLSPSKGAYESRPVNA